MPLCRTIVAGLRLLRVLPTKLEGQIQVQLWESDCLTAYRCLSYTWGEASDDREIWLDGYSFRVRKNLLQFLELACQRFPNEPLWIDAICIDQSNDIEKANEVRRMNEIYTSAKEVLVWLGNSTLSHDTVAWIHADQLECPQPVTRQLTRLGELEYWSRTWVTQEILLAKRLKILIGTHAFEWTNFGPGVTAALNGLSHWHQLNFFWQHWTYTQNKHVDGSICSMYAYGSTLLPFWDLFSWRGDAQCSDPRDRIYGLLALIRDRGESFTVDYTERVASLFWRAGTHFNAWALPNRTATLFRALSLNSQSIIDAAPGRVPLPIIYASLASASRIVYVRGNRAFPCGNTSCLGSIPFTSNPDRWIVLCMGVSPREGEDPQAYVHGLIAPTRSVTGDDFDTIIFPPYFPRDYQHKDRPTKLPQPALQVHENRGKTVRWLNISRISLASQAAFMHDVNSKAYRFRLQVPSTFVSDYLEELFLYRDRMLELEWLPEVLKDIPSPT